MNGYFTLYVAHYVAFLTGLYSFRPRHMMSKNINFKLVSLYVRGIRSFEKRKAVFNWLYKCQADICFLQETYSTPEVVNIWKKQWKGDTFFSHGSRHSKGTMILVKEQLDFKLISSKIDPLGRYIFLEAEIQDSPFVLLNIYAPNKCAEQCVFFSELSEELKDFVTDADKSVVVGGILISFLIKTLMVEAEIKRERILCNM